MAKNPRPSKVGKFTPRPDGFFPPEKRKVNQQATLANREQFGDAPVTDEQWADSVVHTPVQGQLFTGGHEHPWPRGYSPERQAEVRGALDTRSWTY